MARVTARAGLALALAGCHRGRAATGQLECVHDPAVTQASVVRATRLDGVVEGMVFDAQSLEPLGTAMVTVPGTPLGTLVDSSGRFRLPRLEGNVRDGLVVIRTRRVAFEEHLDSLSLLPGQGARVHIYLTANPVCLLESRTGR